MSDGMPDVTAYPSLLSQTEKDKATIVALKQALREAADHIESLLTQRDALRNTLQSHLDKLINDE